MSKFQVEKFIVLVNDRLLHGKQFDTLQSIWKEVTYFETCKVIVKTGERIGQLCGKACVKNKDTCMCHEPRPEKVKVEKEYRQRCVRDVKTGSCIRFCVDGTIFCRYHQPKGEPFLCTFTLMSGKRKNTECGNPCVSGLSVCKRHLLEKKQDDVKV